MRVRHPHHPRNRGRAGKILVFFVLLLPALLGVLGLVIDAGLLMTAQRHAQNAADAGALRAALALLRGSSLTQATTDATRYVQTFNGLANAPAPAVNSPPTQGGYTDSTKWQNGAQYVEV